MARLQIQLADVQPGARAPATMRGTGALDVRVGRLNPNAGALPLGAGMITQQARIQPIDIEAAGATGRGLERAGTALGEMAERHALLATEEELNSRRGDYVRRLTAAREEIDRSNLETPEAAQEAFRTRARELRDEMGDNLSPRARSRWNLIASDLALPAELRTAEDTRTRIRQGAVANAQEQLRIMGNEAARARNPQEEAIFFQQAEEIVQGLTLAGAVNPQQRAALLRGFGADVVQARVVGMIATNPQQAMAYLQSPAVARYLDADRVAALTLQATNRVDTLAARADAQMARRTTVAQQALNEFNGLLSQGIVPTDRADRMLALARGTPFEATARQLVADAGVVRQFVTASPTRQAGMLAEVDARRRGPNASDVDQSLFARLTQAREGLDRAYDQNGIGVSVALGVIPPLPALNWSDPATLAARTEAAAGESARLGRRISPFTRDDLVAGVEQFVRASPEQRLGIIQALGNMADGAERARVIQEFERARGDAGRMPAGAVMRIFETMQAGTPAAMLAARRLVADLGTDVSDRARMAGERPEFNAALESAQDRGVQGVLREQARIAGGGAYAGALNLDMDLIRRTAQVRIASGESPTDAIRNAQAEVSAARVPLVVSGLAQVVVPAGTATGGLDAGFRALRERLTTGTPDPAAGAQAGQVARERAAAARSAVWINAGSGFALVVPGIPTPLTRATLDEVRAAGTIVQQQRQTETQPRAPGQQRTGRMLPPAQTDAPSVEVR